MLVTRLVLQPALLTGLVLLALRLRLFRPPDPMFLLTLLLSNATPTAINMQASALAGGLCGSMHVQLGSQAGLCFSAS